MIVKQMLSSLVMFAERNGRAYKQVFNNDKSENW